ncbi:uncharacterized protein BT62DRAFT_924026 [Guyanagaster necrorhizus]|uniref:Uncharacterized protein n=1 Tax=Guyanagaster necrorhizus TaxID=856835 RepID=A0A9P8AN34_9AGAR|nr:uncharacterized protein BT62DRAFT_924026 [Guyanagaster necrorhizus MCA 3950]KAG7440482.1 hypothetical protein BT62DRAFT_924026 [Guyanagaster necrorhizus MCA 3950]
MTSNPSTNVESVTALAKHCEDLVEECVRGTINILDFADRLHQLGISSEAAGDYIRLLQEWIKQAGLWSLIIASSNIQDGDNKDIGVTDHREATPSDLSQAEIEEFQQKQVKKSKAAAKQCQKARSQVVEEAAWVMLCSKLQFIHQTFSMNDLQSSIATVLAGILRLGDTVSPKTASISLMILAQAPHLTSIIATDQGYDYNEKAKELMAGYAIIRKDVSSAKKSLRSESDWCRVYDAWARGVQVLYPHHEAELKVYWKYVVKVFWAAPHDSTVAIHIDEEV